MAKKPDPRGILALSAVLLAAFSALSCEAAIESARAGAALFGAGMGVKSFTAGEIQVFPLPQPEPPAGLETAAPAGPGSSGADVRKKYEHILRKQSPDTLSELNPAQMKALFDAVSRNRVAGLDMLPRYDPNGELGFCFGRGMAAHLLARRMGLKEAGAGKIFIVGDLKSGETTEWRFHTAAVIKGRGNIWHAIDPIMPGPVTAREWIKRVRDMWDARKKAKIYIAPPDTVIPDVRIFPAPGEEKGEHIIEISFDPADKPGFIPFPADFGPLVFSIDEKAAEKYFLNVRESAEADSFDFLGITVNGGRYDYRNYFADLMDDIMSQKQNAGPSALKAPEFLNGAAGYEIKDLFSPRWGTR